MKDIDGGCLDSMQRIAVAMKIDCLGMEFFAPLLDIDRPLCSMPSTYIAAIPKGYNYQPGAYITPTLNWPSATLL